MKANSFNLENINTQL